MSGVTKRQIKARIAELQAELEQLRAQVAEREGAIAELVLLLQKKEQVHDGNHSRWVSATSTNQ